MPVENSHPQRSMLRSKSNARSISQLASVLIILALYFIFKQSTALSNIAAPDVLAMALCTDVLVYMCLVNMIYRLVQARDASDEGAMDMFLSLVEK